MAEKLVELLEMDFGAAAQTIEAADQESLFGDAFEWRDRRVDDRIVRQQRSTYMQDEKFVLHDVAQGAGGKFGNIPRGLVGTRGPVIMTVPHRE